MKCKEINEKFAINSISDRCQSYIYKNGRHFEMEVTWVYIVNCYFEFLS